MSIMKPLNKPVTHSDLVGPFQVHYPGPRVAANHLFNVRCTKTENSSTKSAKFLKHNESISPLGFLFESKDYKSKDKGGNKNGVSKRLDKQEKGLPEWLRNSKEGVTRPIEIEQWGAPYFSYTCVVDGEAYLAVKESSCIRWVCCRNGDCGCTWTKIVEAKKTKKAMKSTKLPITSTKRSMKAGPTTQKMKAMKSMKVSKKVRK